MNGERTVYFARLVPIDRWTVIHDRDCGEIMERFDRFTFSSEQRDPGRVTVDLRHVDEHDVGRLIRLQPRGGWWECAFELTDRNLSVVAKDLLRVGAPVSVGFVPLLEQHVGDGAVFHQIARLENVSIVHRGAYDGAQVTNVIRLPAPAPRRATAPNSPDEPLALRRPCGVILGIR